MIREYGAVAVNGESGGLVLLDGECKAEPEAIRAVETLLSNVVNERRTQIYEHEAYAMIESIGELHPPVHVFVPNGHALDPTELVRFHHEKVVLKLVSPEIVHKSDVGAVAFVENDLDAIQRGIETLYHRHEARVKKIAGVLIVEFVDHDQLGFGRELFVGIRHTREFGPVIAAGLGGVDTEYLAVKLKPRVAVAKALANHVTAEGFLDLFRQTAAYDVIAGKARGHVRLVSDAELCQCFDVFIQLARTFCNSRTGDPALVEFEVNPFTFRSNSIVPLDGRGRLGSIATPTKSRPLYKIDALLEPKSMAIIGVSSKRDNFGRIILKNTIRCGFPKEQLTVIKDGEKEIDGVQCVPRICDLNDPVDLLVLAASGDPAEFAKEINESGKVHSVILIPGGMGETEGSEDVPAALRDAIDSAAKSSGDRSVYLGGNCLGIRSRPGKYDTFFIPEDRLDPMPAIPVSRAAFIAQSGGFIISRLSNWEYLNPALCISIGNQLDLTVSDLLERVAERDDIDVIGVYMEGFRTGDGEKFVQAVGHAAHSGKNIIFYKAGRTAAGRSAMEGHTASIAGDYDVCQTAVSQAGAIVTETFKEFEQVMELAVRLHGRPVKGRRLAAISNAGFEAVGMADAINGPHYEVEMAKLSKSGIDRMTEMFEKSSLTSLANINNPLDLTPMADDQTYESALATMLEDENVDAMVAALVPMAPMTKALPHQLDHPDSLVARLVRVFKQSNKPLAFVIDCGPPFVELARRIRSAGVPVFPSSDQAVRSMGRYLCHGSAHRFH